MTRLSLRTRVTAIFAGGVLILSALMATLSYEFIRTRVLAERERTAVRLTYIDASVVVTNISGDGSSIGDVLSALDTGIQRRPLVVRGDRVFARNADVGSGFDIPVGLAALVKQGQPAQQVVHTSTGPALIIGVPLGSSGAQYYEIYSLAEISGELADIALILTLVAVGTTLAGAGLGWYTTRRALRPLASVAAAARGIAAGDLKARLDAAAEPELEQLTASFNHMVDQLAQRIERDRRFAADVSHELRSPLQTLSAAAAVLVKRRDALDARTATAAQLVAEEIDRFQHMVTDLLEMAKADQPTVLSYVDMEALARTQVVQRDLDPALVRVGAGVDPWWRVDRRRFEHIIANLLDNAQRHGGGTVAVTIDQFDGLGTLDVDDEGPGVRAEDRKAIFDPFVRGRASRARADSDGTGLGLAIVAQHALAHGGRAMVLTRPGGGARFRVEVPLAAGIGDGE